MDCLVDVERLYDENQFIRIEKIQAQNVKSEYHQWLWDRYNNHATWLERAIKDLKRGDRLAFGAKLTTTHNKTPVIVGSIILKKEDYYDDKVAELKNLVVDESSLDKILWGDKVEKDENGIYKLNPDQKIEKMRHIKGIWHRIISKVDGFCTRRGFKRMVFEVPFDQNELIGTFFAKGFIIAEAKPSYYQTGDLIYRMSKELPKSYSGDPFYVNEMGRWLVEEYLGYKFVQNDFEKVDVPPECENTNEGEILHQTRTRSFNFANTNRRLEEIDEFPLTGKLVVIDDWYLKEGSDQEQGDQDDDNNSEIEVPPTIQPNIIRYLIKSSNLNIILTYFEQKELRNTCERIGIKYLSRENDQNLFGKNSTIKAITFPRGDIAGITLVVGNDFLEDCETKIEESSNYIFYLNGSTGKCIGDTDTQKLLILYYAPSSQEFEGKPGIWGYSHLIKQAFSNNALKPMSKIKDTKKSRELGQDVYYEFFDFFDEDKASCDKYKKLIKYNEEGPIVSLILTKPKPIHNKGCLLLETIFGADNPYLKNLMTDSIIYADFYINQKMRKDFDVNVKVLEASSEAAQAQSVVKTSQPDLDKQTEQDQGGKKQSESKSGEKHTYIHYDKCEFKGEGPLEFHGGQHANGNMIFIEKIDKFVLGDYIKKAEYKQTNEYTKDQFNLVLSALKIVPTDKEDELKDFAKIILKSKEPEPGHLEKLKDFVVKHGGPVIDGIAASTIFEIMKGIIC